MLFWSVVMNLTQTRHITVAKPSRRTHFTDACTALGKLSNFQHIHLIHVVQDPNLDSFLGQQTHKPCGNKKASSLCCISKPKSPPEEKKIKKALDWDSTQKVQNIESSLLWERSETVVPDFTSSLGEVWRSPAKTAWVKHGLHREILF